MSLKNLNQIKTETLQNYKQSFVSTDFILSSEFKKKFLTIGETTVSYHNYYAEAKTSSNLKIFIPYQWFVIASYFVEYYIELINYQNKIKPLGKILTDFNTAIVNCRHNEQNSRTAVNKLNDISEAESDFLVSFLSDYEWWGGGKTPDRADFYVSPILNLAGLVNNTQAFVAEITKAFAENLSAFETFHYNEAKDLDLPTVGNFDQQDYTKKLVNSRAHTQNQQVIYYGVPGCGKSHCIEEETKDYPNELKPRVVFHPEYTNADFIGQILPIVKDIPDDSGAIQESKIGYDFIPGPFTSILLKACANLNRSYCLIIEEINRGNAAAIFGDIFQLLDRGDDGWSKYSVINRDILNYLKKLSKETEQYYADILTPQEASSVLKLLESGLKLPPNLSILATMNTSDQNVFTLDNAFQRRFGMKLIKNEFEDNKESQTQKNALIDGAKTSEGPSDISWFKFQTEINKKISEVSRERGLSSMEDKRLGCWFVKNNEGKISAEDFVNKILKYLWDDAFKFDREAIFAKSYDSLETMISDYSEKGFDIFESNFKTALISAKELLA